MQCYVLLNVQSDNVALSVTMQQGPCIMLKGSIDGCEAGDIACDGIVPLRQDVVAVVLDVVAAGLVDAQEEGISAVMNNGADLLCKIQGDGPSSQSRSTKRFPRWSRLGYRNCEPRD